ncbi:hypothetical protein M413DRAFT_447368 [Hebeloma cylindrosporum]|uniref:Uncharacterized protein n=1 Tax=Hebeloma cylindrosporum TaxID=76867 RepID=A0A0C3BQS5_HEBCY|nr:hypothetical protein M413DRAFT_447368 [Hebeloma cylindrosporum h7]
MSWASQSSTSNWSLVGCVIICGQVLYFFVSCFSSCRKVGLTRCLGTVIALISTCSVIRQYAACGESGSVIISVVGRAAVVRLILGRSRTKTFGSDDIVEAVGEVE